MPTLPSAPRVSVIVPVHNRCDLLAELFDALAAQTYTDFELVVVDNGSTDGAGELADKEVDAGRIGTRVVVVHQEPAGSMGGRRSGVSAAEGDVFAFTDSDCVPAPDWLARGVAAIDGGADVVMGRTRSARPRRPLERSVSANDNGLYPTCNVFYRRDAFLKADGFDRSIGDRFGFRPGMRAKHAGFGEDTLLGWHVRRAGRAVYEPDAVVAHAVLPLDDLRDHWSRTVQAGAFPALIREIPELRATLLWRRVFLGPTRIPLYLAVLALVLRRPVPAAALAAGWVGWHWRAVSTREPSRKQRLKAMPIVLGTDAVTAAALVAGSVRARSVVL